VYNIKRTGAQNVSNRTLSILVIRITLIIKVHDFVLVVTEFIAFKE